MNDKGDATATRPFCAYRNKIRLDTAVLFSAGQSPEDVPTRAVLRNAFGMLAARLIGVVALVSVAPFALQALGTTGYGVWESIRAVSGIGIVLQGVINGTLLWQMSRTYGVRDLSEARRVLRVSIGVTLSLATVSSLAVWVVAGQLCETLQVPVEHALVFESLLPATTYMIQLGGINQALFAVASGFQQAGRAALAQTIGLVAASLGAVIAVWCGWGLNALLLSACAGFAINFLCLYPLASSLCGPLSLWPQIPKSEDLLTIGPFAGLLLLSNSTLFFRDHLDKLLLSAIDSPRSTAYLGIALQLTILIAQICSVLYTPFTAAVGSAFARGDHRQIQSLYAFFAPLFALVAGLLATLICTLRKPMFVMWFGTDMPEVESYLAITLLGTTTAIALSAAGVALAKGMGRAGLETAYLIVTLLLTLISKPLFVAFFGPIGAIISSAVSWAVGAGVLVMLLHRTIDLPWQVTSRVLCTYALTLILASLGWWCGAWLAAPASRSSAALYMGCLAPVISIGYLGAMATLRLIFLELFSPPGGFFSCRVLYRTFRVSR